MEPEQKSEVQIQEKIPSVWNSITPLSKYLAMAFFIILPFVGGWVGYTFAPEKVVVQEIEVKNAAEPISNQDDVEKSVDLQENNKSSSPYRESELTSLIKAEYDEEKWSNTSDKVKSILQEINYDWLEEVSFKTFSLMGVDGEVIHYCDKGNTIFDRSGSPLCLGENIIMIKLGDKVEVVAEADTPTQDSLFKLHEIFFNEGKFQKVTESEAEEARLLIVIDELACIDVYADMCFSDFSLSYVINVADLKTSPISKISPIGYDTGRPVSGSGSLISQWPLSENFYWNQSGTKAIYDTPCPAGCPDSVYEGFDLNTQTVVPLLSRIDGYYNGQFGGGPDKEDLEWISENEIRVETSTLSF